MVNTLHSKAGVLLLPALLQDSTTMVLLLQVLLRSALVLLSNTSLHTAARHRVRRRNISMHTVTPFSGQATLRMLAAVRLLLRELNNSDMVPPAAIPSNTQIVRVNARRF
jgi:hypothetical protein